MVFGDEGLAFVRVKLGKSLGQPDYWEKLTISELDSILDVILKAEQIERYEAWQHTAYICSLLANIHKDSKAHPRPFKVEDFIPVEYPGQKQEQQKPQSWQEMKATMQELAAMMNKGR